MANHKTNKTATNFKQIDDNKIKIGDKNLLQYVLHYHDIHKNEKKDAPNTSV